LEQNEDDDDIDPAEYVAAVHAIKALGDESLLAAHPELADPQTMREIREEVFNMFGSTGITRRDLVVFVANNPWIHTPLVQEFLFQAVKNYRAERKTRTAAALRAAKSRKTR
jgi:hypothetical protein